ncbi:MAG: preprotein translocase subunit SecD [Methanoregulaceae archaeon]|jgi:preprotein translocase subunit SecD
MTGKEWVALLKNWQVAMLVILLVLSVVFIYPHAEDGKFTTNLQYGLDLSDGTWLQMEFQAVVTGFETDRPVVDFLSDLQKNLDAEIYRIDDQKIEIRKYFTRDELESAFAKSGGRLTTYEQGVSRETAEQVKVILEEKLNALGTRDAKVNPLIGLSGVSSYVRVELAGVGLAQAQEIVGKQGRFEIRIQTTGNETEHVLYGDTINTVGVPTQEGNRWGVSFTLTEQGAVQFRDAAIRYGATTDPSRHYLNMILDGNVVYSAPLGADLAAKLQVGPERVLVASTGAGQEGLDAAKTLEIHLRAGALPVEVKVAGSGYVPAALSDYFKTMAIVAFVVATIAVGIVVFLRYREPSIVLPMIGINLSEIVILLGVASLIQQQLDLAAIAGLIAVLGTGIDQLVIITDEVLHEGKVPSPNIYQKRLTRAIGIIMISAVTVIIAMLPLALMSLSTLRGFAIITILGVVIGVLVTRPAYGKIIMAILSK